MTGLISVLAPVIGYIERKLGMKYDKLSILALLVGLLDVLLTIIASVFVKVSPLIGIFILFFIAVSIEAALSNTREVLSVMTVGLYVLLFVVMLSLLGILEVGSVLPILEEITIGKMIVIILKDMVFTILGASVASLVEYLKRYNLKL